MGAYGMLWLIYLYSGLCVYVWLEGDQQCDPVERHHVILQASVTVITDNAQTHNVQLLAQCTYLNINSFVRVYACDSFHCRCLYRHLLILATWRQLYLCTQC